jgi:hypothetical protein
MLRATPAPRHGRQPSVDLTHQHHLALGVFFSGLSSRGFMRTSEPHGQPAPGSTGAADFPASHQLWRCCSCSDSVGRHTFKPWRACNGTARWSASFSSATGGAQDHHGFCSHRESSNSWRQAASEHYAAGDRTPPTRTRPGSAIVVSMEFDAGFAQLLTQRRARVTAGTAGRVPKSVAGPADQPIDPHRLICGLPVAPTWRGFRSTRLERRLSPRLQQPL